MSEKKLDYIAERLDGFIDKQDVAHADLTKHIGEQEQFQERMLDFKEDFSKAHEELRTRHEGLSSRVAWIIGVGSAVVFVIGTLRVFTG